MLNYLGPRDCSSPHPKFLGLPLCHVVHVFAVFTAKDFVTGVTKTLPNNVESLGELHLSKCSFDAIQVSTGSVMHKTKFLDISQTLKCMCKGVNLCRVQLLVNHS